MENSIHIFIYDENEIRKYIYRDYEILVKIIEIIIIIIIIKRGEIVRSTQTRSDSQHGLQSRNLTSKRHKWTSEEYQEILRCYFITTEIYSNYPVTKKTYEIWEIPS